MSTSFPAPVPATGPPLPPGREIVLAGRGSTFVREVAGPPGAATLLLLHGWTVTADLNWYAAYEALGRHFHLVAMDHRGHGRGVRSRRPFRLEDCADDAAALAAVLGIDALVPVGYSMGGPVAQLLWQRHRGLVRGLVLSATGRSFSGASVQDRIYFAGLLGLSVASRLTPAPLRRQLAGSLARRRLANSPIADWALAEMARNDPSAILEAGWAIGRFRSHAWISGVDVPTAVIVTARDHVVAPARQRRLAESIPSSRLWEVDGDHGACVTAADRYVPVLVDACLEVAERAGF